LKAAPFSFEVPYKTPIADQGGLVQRAWSFFFRNVQSALDPLGVEKYFSLVNNQASAANIEGLKFDYAKVGQVIVDYLIQRVTTSTGATELIETGQFYLVYKPTSATWALTSGPSTAGITLSVTSAGQVQYTSSNITGTASISKITFRARTMAAKNSQYSVAGAT
jgi:hypothetical protein